MYAPRVTVSCHLCHWTHTYTADTHVEAKQVAQEAYTAHMATHDQGTDDDIEDPR